MRHIIQSRRRFLTSLLAGPVGVFGARPSRAEDPRDHPRPPDRPVPRAQADLRSARNGFLDAREVEDGTQIETDVCVIGAGAAGIAIAHELAGTRVRVLVLESGGFEYDARTQSLYDAENIGLQAYNFVHNRLRFFGGTTNHWAGHCRPFDAIDFERRAWVPYSGWPLTRRELDPYYARAQPLCQLPPAHYEDLDFWLSEDVGLTPLALDPARLKNAIYNQSPPTRFGEVYRAALARAPNVTIYLHANALELETDDDAASVTAVQVACIDGPRFVIRPRIVVLAAGALETARILLLSNRVVHEGLGNRNQLVGRFLQDHVAVRPAAFVQPTKPGLDLPLYSDVHEVNGGEIFAVLAASPEMMRAERIQNFRIHVSRAALPSASEYSLIVLKRAVERGKWPDALGWHVANVLTDLDDVARLMYRRYLRSDAEGSERAPSFDGFQLHLALEPIPNPDSRVMLTDQHDLFDQRRIAVEWQLAPDDLITARRAVELAALEFHRLGVGRVWGSLADTGEDWPPHLMSGRHHCGTTRMADDPQRRRGRPRLSGARGRQSVRREQRRVSNHRLCQPHVDDRGTVAASVGSHPPDARLGEGRQSAGRSRSDRRKAARASPSPQ
jgi:choline dehydrogenase-like flavoprotein